MNQETSPTMTIVSHGHKNAGAISTPPSVADGRVAETLSALNRFELGRFLLSNLGLNGFWTSYILLHPDQGRTTGLSSDGSAMTELEAWMLDRCPIVLATQERFRTFRELTQPLIRSGMRLASIPSGLMDDLLTLDYLGFEDIVLTAVDLDAESLDHAKTNYQRTGKPVTAEFEQRDAWRLDSPHRWDLVTSNGLNIYIEDDEVCTRFYAGIAQALRPEGLFVMSFITPPEQWKPYNGEDLEYQSFLFKEVMPVKWQCVRDENTTREQLAAAGFEVLTMEYDEQRMFPAVVARKRAEG